MGPKANQSYERLSEEVRLYPCILDEAVKSRSWLEIASKLEYTDEKVARGTWENFKKLLPKRRKRVQDASRSGCGSEGVADAQRQLDELNYASWLAPYQRLRNTTSNIQIAEIAEYGEMTPDEQEVIIEIISEKSCASSSSASDEPASAGKKRAKPAAKKRAKDDDMDNLLAKIQRLENADKERSECEPELRGRSMRICFPSMAPKTCGMFQSSLYSLLIFFHSSSVAGGLI